MLRYIRYRTTCKFCWNRVLYCHFELRSPVFEIVVGMNPYHWIQLDLYFSSFLIRHLPNWKVFNFIFAFVWPKSKNSNEMLYNNHMLLRAQENVKPLVLIRIFNIEFNIRFHYWVGSAGSIILSGGSIEMRRCVSGRTRIAKETEINIPFENIYTCHSLVIWGINIYPVDHLFTTTLWSTATASISCVFFIRYAQ